MDYQFNRHRIDKITQGKILEELESVAKHFDYIEFGWRDFNKVANINANTIKRQLGSWSKAIDLLKSELSRKGLELKPRSKKAYTTRELFNEMDRIWNNLGHRPSRIEWEQSTPKIHYQTYRRYFGGWTNACLKFIEYKMGESIKEQPVSPKISRKPNVQPVPKIRVSSKRDIPLGLRLKVLNRDNFRCVFCGRSPATDLGVKLHIDHIKPFSSGGKTILDNLQTLCFDCNLGKGNREI